MMSSSVSTSSDADLYQCLLKLNLSLQLINVDNLPIRNKYEYLKCEPMLNADLTSLMVGLSGCTVHKLESDIQLITMSESALDKACVKSSRQFIYARKFYPELLKSIREKDWVVLLSNPGTGKSMFQFYYLARLLNPSVFEESLPCDSLGSSEVPEVVIRQVGTNKMQVYFVKAKEVHEVSLIQSRLFRCFDPKHQIMHAFVHLE